MNPPMEMVEEKNVYDFEVVTIDGKSISLEMYEGQVLLLVNTASECGFTNQYEGLEKLYQAYKDSGLVVLGFPCNQFGGQEPGDNKQIKQFCELNYGVTFPLLEKIEVNGENTHPLFKHLKESSPGLLGSKKIKWNFTKFLVDRSGKVVIRYAPNVKPASLEEDLKELL